jgi:hypothetical protein
MKNNMLNKIISISTILALMILSTSSIINAQSIRNQSITYLGFKTINQNVYLGSASIFGDGGSSILEAIAENDLLIKLDSTSSYVDLYINYEMNCSGATDEGVITLTIFINDKNVSINAVQTPNIKNGILEIQNVKVQRGDRLTFSINVVYGSISPLYSNSTSSTGIGVFSKLTFDIEESLYYSFRNQKQNSNIFLSLIQILKDIKWLKIPYTFMKC